MGMAGISSDDDDDDGPRVPDCHKNSRSQQQKSETCSAIISISSVASLHGREWMAVVGEGGQ